MGFGSSISKAFSSTKNYISKKWNGAKSKVSSGLFGSNKEKITEDTEISGPVDVSPEEAHATTRGILKPSAIQHTAHYDKISKDKDVIDLMSKAEDFETVLQGFHIPFYSGDESSFLNQVATINGDVMSTLYNMKEDLLKYKDIFIGKKKKQYEGIISTCIIYVPRIDAEIEYCNKIQERLMYAIRSKNYKSIPSGASYENMLNNMDYIKIFQEVESEDKEIVGNGQMNTVYKLMDEERGEKRVFKKGANEYNWDGEEGKAQGQVYSRLMVEKVGETGSAKINTANRDVAVSIIDKLFRLDAAVDTSMAKSASGQNSSLMDFASGQEIEKNRFYIGEDNKHDLEFINDLMESKDVRGNVIGLAEKRLKAAQEKGDQEKITSNLNEIKKAKKKKQNRDHARYIDAGTSEFVESAYNLAALDIIVGHVDRHSGNIMLDEHGVKGIDNDTAFSLRTASGLSPAYKEDQITDFDSMSYRQAAQAGAMHNGVQLQNDNQAILFFDTAFPVAPAPFIEKICAVNPDAVAGALKGLVGEAEIEACVGRVKELQHYLETLPDSKVVASFDDIDRNQYANTTHINSYGNYYAQILNNHDGGIEQRREGLENLMTRSGNYSYAATLFEKDVKARMPEISGMTLTQLTKQIFQLMVIANRKERVDIEGVFHSEELNEYIIEAIPYVLNKTENADDMHALYYVLGEERKSEKFINERIKANVENNNRLKAIENSRIT